MASKFLILHGSASPISGSYHHMQKIEFSVGLIEKNKFQDFISSYKKQIEDYLAKDFKNFKVDNEATFSKHTTDKLEGEIKYIILFEDQSTNIMTIHFSEFETNTFEHNEKIFQL